MVLRASRTSTWLLDHMDREFMKACPRRTHGFALIHYVDETYSRQNLLSNS